MHRFGLFLPSFLLILTSPIAMKQAGAAVPCDLVIQELNPCVSFLGGEATSPSKTCCQGAEYVFKHFGGDKGDRQGVCTCLVSVMPYLDGPVNGTLVSSLPKDCGINIKLPPFSNNFDCSKVN